MKYILVQYIFAVLNPSVLTSDLALLKIYIFTKNILNDLLTNKKPGHYSDESEPTGLIFSKIKIIER